MSHPIYKPLPPQVSLSPSPSPNRAGFSNAIDMDQFNLGRQYGGSPGLLNELVTRVLLYERNLIEIKRALDEMGFRLAQPSANHGPGFNNTFAPGDIVTPDRLGPAFVLDPHRLSSNATAPYQNLTYSGPGLDGEFGRPGVCSVVA